MQTNLSDVTRAVIAAIAFVLLGTVSAAGQEIWSARDGTMTLTLSNEALARHGLSVEDPFSLAALGGALQTVELSLAGGTDIRFAIDDDGLIDLFARNVRTTEGLTLVTVAGRREVLDFALIPNLGEPPDGVDDDSKARRGPLYLELRFLKVGLDRRSNTFQLGSREITITPRLAAALGRPELTGVSIGWAEITAPALWVGGDAPRPVDHEPLPDGGDRVDGPDMVFCQLYGLSQFGRAADIVGLGVATTSWNVGNEVLPWFQIPDPRHPFIVMNLFRLKTVNGSDRLEQIGQSWIKHGFCALDNEQCSTQCQSTGCSTLGLGCTDTYGAGLNASQGGLGPRYEVNPWTRGWTNAGSHMQGGHSHDAIEHRLQVHDGDLDSAQNPGATYYSEGYYVCPEDINQMNSAAWKPVTVSGSPGGTWSFGMSGSGTMPVEGFAIDVWAGATQTILAEEIPVVEFVSPDGRCKLAAKATDLGGGVWHYEYALLNVDMDRKAGSFSVPIPGGASVSNVGFHAVAHHNEGVAGYNNDPWTWQVAGGAITWSTVANPIRWGTLYNFRFDADAEPGDVTVTLGMFESGTPGSVSGTSVGPFGPPPVCGDGVVEGGEECDPPDGVHCDANCQWICGDGVVQSGEECDPPDGVTCDANCQIIYICGDGVTDPGEECDDAGESATCDDDCTFAVCGDGTINTTAGEVCDDAGESPTCDDDCTAVVCGDGNTNEAAGEQCDDGNTVPGDGCDEFCQSESNDLCENAIPICNGTVSGSTAGANSDGSASCGASSSSPDVWYSYTPGTSGAVTVDTCGSPYDTVLSIHTGCPGTSGNQLACNDDTCGLQSQVSTTVVGGTTYWIRVSGYNGLSGDFTLILSGPDCGQCENVLFEDHFETDLGWTVVNEFLDDGAWERGDPAGAGNRGDPTDDFDGGGQCYLTDNVSGNSDVDGGPTRLISPTIDMSNGDITLSYGYWFYWDDGTGTDALIIDVSTNDGASWTQVASHNDVGQEVWRANSVFLDDFVTPSATTRIRFSVQDNPNNSVVEAAVDVVVICSSGPGFPDCNGNGRDDAEDIACGGGNTCGGIEGSYDCNENGVPDECEGGEQDYEIDVSPPLLIPDCSPAGASHTFNVPDSFTIDDLDIDLTITHTWMGDLCVTVTHPDGVTSATIVDRPGMADPGPCDGTGCCGCSADNYAGVILDDEGSGGPVEGLCTPDLASPPNYTPNNPLSVFDGMEAAGDWTISFVDGACGDIGTLDHWSLHFTTVGGGVDPCVPPGDAIRGGEMWDKWWVVNGAPPPTGNHPLYPPAGAQSGSTTYRCKECHGWDYKGVDGAYGSGSHYTGIPGVFGSTMTPADMFDLIKLDSVPNGHGFENYGLSDQDVWDLVQFVQDLVIDTDTYIDGDDQFLGDPVQGEINYTNSPPGSTACSNCHGLDGTAINFGAPDDPAWVGTVAVRNPGELLHKIRFGQPGAPMMSYLDFGGTDQGAADIGRYAQLTFPVECTGAAHCDDDLYCTGVETCAAGYCVDGTDPCEGTGLVCNEADSNCVQCLIDVECDDGLFCSGTETCDQNTCVEGTDPCQQNETCDEDNDQCITGEIPTLTEWGAVLMTLLLLTAGTIVFARRRQAMKPAARFQGRS